MSFVFHDDFPLRLRPLAENDATPKSISSKKGRGLTFEPSILDDDDDDFVLVEAIDAEAGMAGVALVPRLVAIMPRGSYTILPFIMAIGST